MRITSPPLPTAAGPTQKQRATIEIALVLIVFWLPTLISGLSTYFGQHTAASIAAPSATVYNFVVRLGRIAIILFLMWNGGRKFWVFGLRRPTFKVFLVGLALFALMFLTAVGYILVCYSLDLQQFFTRISPGSGTTGERALMLSAGVIYEELFYRAFLLTRLKNLGWHRYSTIIFSATIFALPHIYEGLAPVPLIFVHGLFFAWIFLRFKSIWPGLVAHWLYDALVLLLPVLLALLKKGS